MHKLQLDLSAPELTGLNVNRVFFADGKIEEMTAEQRAMFTNSTVTVDDRFYTISYKVCCQCKYKAGKKPADIQIKDSVSAELKVQRCGRQ